MGVVIVFLYEELPLLATKHEDGFLSLYLLMCFKNQNLFLNHPWNDLCNKIKRQTYVFKNNKSKIKLFKFNVILIIMNQPTSHIISKAKIH